MSSVVSVPLFMFISGYFDYINKIGGRRFYSLIIPFLTWSYLYFLYENSCRIDIESIIDFSENIIRAPYYPSTMWFLRTLFLQILIVYGCTRVREKYQNVCMICTYLIILLIAVFITDKFAIKSIAGNLPYFMFGYWCRRYSLTDKSFFHVIGIIAIPCFAASMYAKEVFASGLILSILFKLTSFIGILSILAIVKIGCNIFKGHTQIAEQLGKETIEIYTTHFLVIWLLRDAGLSITSETMFIIYLAYILVVIPITVLLYKSLNKIRGVSYLLYAKK